MSNEKDTIELSVKGVKQIRSVMYDQLKEYVDNNLEKIANPLMEKRVINYIENKWSHWRFEHEFNEILKELIKKKLESPETQKIMDETIKKVVSDEAVFSNELEKRIEKNVKEGLRSMF